MMLLLWSFAGALGVYIVCLSIYRVFLHPLANIPGPKLCALTGWYEVFWDIIVGGQFTFKIEEWHKTYGPIMRIGPNEVHFNDPDFYNELYTTTAKYQKPAEWRYRFGFGSALFDTVDHDHHAKRRAPLAAFFSRSKILELGPFIQEQTDILVKRIQDYKGEVISANEAFDALTMDIIGYYAFGLDYHSVDYPKFHAPYSHVTEDVARMVHIGAHFPWVFTILKSIPQGIVSLLAPPMKKIFKFNKEISLQIRRILNNASNIEQEKSHHRTIFHEILSSKLAPEELTQERLEMEAGSLVGAALETSKMTTALAIYYILALPDVEKNLREELRTAMPDQSKILTIPELERLPYLAACIREALRLAIGVSQRIRRYNPDSAIQYKEYAIPPHTVFGMCHWEQLRDARIWDRPYQFLPERWLANSGNPLALNGEPLDKYFVPFHRGPRGCLGKEMGMAQLNIGLATLFRRIDHLELFETDQSAVDIVADYFVPLCVKGSKGVRVVAK